MKILDTDSQFKTIGGYPTPFASNEDKAKKELQKDENSR